MRQINITQYRSKGFTLIEMLIAVSVIGVVFPLIFAVMSFALKGLAETEKHQMKNIKYKRFANRLEEDFRTLTKFEYLFDDSVGFYTIRSGSFQDHVEIIIKDSFLYYRINAGQRKKIFNAVNADSSKFEFVTYAGEICEQQNELYFIPPELNTMDKFRLKLFYTADGNLNKHVYTKVLELE